MKVRYGRCWAGVLGVLSLAVSARAGAEEGERTGMWGSEPLNWALASGFESRHVGNRRDLNDHNPGIGLRTPAGWTLGTFNNSFKRQSIYAGHEWQWLLIGQERMGLRAGLVAGAVSGYDGGLHAGGRRGIHLLALPELILRLGDVECALFYVPDGSKSPATWSVQLRLGF